MTRVHLLKLALQTLLSQTLSLSLFVSLPPVLSGVVSHRAWQID